MSGRPFTQRKATEAQHEAFIAELEASMERTWDSRGEANARLLANEFLMEQQQEGHDPLVWDDVEQDFAISALTDFIDGLLRQRYGP